jgi:hypothetical protein
LRFFDGADIPGDRMSDVKSFFQSSYAKIGIGAVLAFVGVIAGIYIGYGLTIGKEQKKDVYQSSGAPTKEAPENVLNLRIGDAFPPETYTDAAGQAGNFESLLKDKEAIILFASVGCDPCLDLLRYTQRSLFKRIKSGVQVVLVIDRDQWPFPEEYQGLAERLQVAVVDGDYWRKTYHLVSWPIIVGVDNSSIIRHVQYGYANAIDYELVGEYFSTD